MQHMIYIQQGQRWPPPALCNTVSVAGCKFVKCRAGATSTLIYSRLCENMQSAGPGLQLIIYNGAVAASRQEQEQQPGGVIQGPGPGANTLSDKSINIGDLQTHRAAPLQTLPTIYSPPPSHSPPFKKNSLSQQQFVLETSILGSRNLTLLMLWFCSHVLITVSITGTVQYWPRWNTEDDGQKRGPVMCERVHSGLACQQQSRLKHIHTPVSNSRVGI